MTKAEYPYIYDASYPYLHEVTKRARNPLYVAREVIKDFALVYNGLELNPGDRLLDVGSCIGSLGHHLSYGGIESYGVDINVAAVRQGRALFNLGEPRTQVANAKALPYRTGSFDAVVSEDVFEHFPTGAFAQSAFDEMARVLKPSKRRMYHKITVLEDTRHMQGDESHFLKWSTLQWTKFFEKNGWEVLRSPTIHIPLPRYGYFFIQKV